MNSSPPTPAAGSAASPPSDVFQHYQVSRRPEDGFAIEPAEIERALTPRTRLVVLCNPHNPSGALLPAETLRALGEIALRRGVRVLVDEVYLEMFARANGEPPFAFPIGQTLAASAEDNPFLITSSLTKAYGLSGLRCGWTLAAPALARRLWRLNDLFAATGAHPAELLAVRALEQIEKFRARAAALLAANRALLDTFLDARRDDLACFRPPAGTVIFPGLRGCDDSAAFVRSLREKYETSVVPGHFFELPAHFRLGLGGDTATLRAGLERVSAALDECARN